MRIEAATMKDADNTTEILNLMNGRMTTGEMGEIL